MADLFEKHFEHTNFNYISTITALAAGVTIKNGHMRILKEKLSGSKAEVIYKYALALANNEQRGFLEEGGSALFRKKYSYYTTKLSKVQKRKLNWSAWLEKDFVLVLVQDPSKFATPTKRKYCL